MTQLDEAIARYHRLLENEKFRDLAWAEALEEELRDQNLTGGTRVILPVLRPHFISKRQYANLVKASEALLSAIDRVKQLALSTPALLSRMELLPAEKMLAAVDLHLVAAQRAVGPKEVVDPVGEGSPRLG